IKYFDDHSTRPENSMGSDEDWEAATNGLKHALEVRGLPYTINEGDGAFYGPKLDFHLEDSIGRTWQCGTIQLDYQLPGRFGLEYTGADGEKHCPVMIHRVVFGSVERFIGVITEHFAGKFPVWLAPVQAKVLLVSEKVADYGKKVTDTLAAAGVRVELDNRNEKIGYMIREAQVVDRVPYMVIIGQKEAEEGLVSIRKRDSAENVTMTLDEFVEKITKQIKERN
ncbi:MAG: His/Gly/Thr/Pro-type tRNA ligase C-terminal domain-containing protein, partial [Clostridia bacterium]|nr:His/Gly/Thr/Pro-type tRNA ligase C-terminal domain-containing protein [Clostridia bacterium]